MKYKMTKQRKLILIGIILGAFLTWFPAGFFVFALFALSVYCINRFVQTPPKSFLLKLFIFGFILRILFSFVNHNLGLMGPYKSVDTQADAVIFNGNAFYIAHVLRGNSYSEESIEALKKDPFLRHSIKKGYYNFSGYLPSIRKYQYNLYTFLLGIFYVWLGYAPIAAKILNGLFGCLSAIWIFYIARILVQSETTAKLSAVLVMFFPSLIYWSVTLLQDPIVNSFFLLYTLSLLIYLSEGGKSSLSLAFVTCFCLSFFKTKIFFILWICLALVLIIRFLRDVAQKKLLTRSISVISLLVVLIIIVSAGHSIITGYIERNLNFIFDYLQASVLLHPSASSYRVFDDAMYTGAVKLHLRDVFNFSLIGSAFKALAYYFLSPFPWHIPYDHPLLLAFYPQVIFTFACIPFALLGVFTCIRRNPYVTLTLGLLLTLIILPQAMAECIIGNAVRHRDMFMPFVFLFSSYGFCLSVLRRDNNLKGSAAVK